MNKNNLFVAVVKSIQFIFRKFQVIRLKSNRKEMQKITSIKLVPETFFDFYQKSKNVSHRRREFPFLLVIINDADAFTLERL